MRLDFATFVILLAFLVICYRLIGRKKQSPSIPVTSVEPFQQKRSWKIIGAATSRWLFWASLLFLAIALSHPLKVEEIRPEITIAKSNMPRSGIALYFLLDESGSMKESVSTIDERGARIEIPKIDLAKQAIHEFVEGKKGLNLPGRRDDLVGLIAFARIPEVLCPLTLNRSEIVQALNRVQPIQEEERNGTAIGYAIFKAVNIIVATKYFAKRQEEEHKGVYSIKNQAIIIITDGLQSPHPADKENPFRFMPPEEAITYAKDNGIRVYYIGIDPVLAQSEFADDVKKMKEAMRGSGGELFIANPSQPIEKILSEVDTMEKSELPPETVITVKPTQEISLVHFFVALAMISLASAVLLETTLARSVP